MASAFSAFRSTSRVRTSSRRRSDIIIPQAENTEASAGTTTLADAQLLRERGRVHGAAAAEGDQGEVARVEAAVDGDQLERVDHVVVGDAHDAAGGFVGVDAEPRSHRLDRLLDRVHVGLHLAAAEIVAVDAAQPEIGVGGGGLRPAAPVGRRARHGAGRARADAQLAVVVDPGDRAAAVADLHQVHDGDHDRVAGRGAGAPDPVVGLDPHARVLDQRALGGGAADVERQHVGLADEAAELGRAPDAGRRPRFHHGDGNARDRVDGIDAAVRLHDVESAGEVALGEARVEALQVALRHRLHVGRQHGGAGALVLAPLARDLVRGDGGDLRPQPLELGQRRLLVRRVGIGVEEADRDRLHAFRPEVRDDAGQRREVEGTQLVAVVVHAARQLAAQAARHEGLGLFVVEVEEVRPVAARDLQRVAKALRGDEADAHAGALGQRVDDDGGAVGEEAHGVGRDPRLRHDVEHALLVAGRGGVGLRRADRRLAGGLVGLEDQQVGEGAADVGCDTDGPGHQRTP